MEGIGSALPIPPVYILATVSYAGTESRARAFGAISAAGGIGAAAYLAGGGGKIVEMKGPKNGNHERMIYRRRLEWKHH